MRRDDVEVNIFVGAAEHSPLGINERQKMKRQKPIIFISHIHEDADIAYQLKKFLDESFIGIFDIFVSSDGASIRSGDKWSSVIERSLNNAELVLALISSESKDRRWIYFECGGAYFSNKHVIPVCCRNLSMSELED